MGQFEAHASRHERWLAVPDTSGSCRLGSHPSSGSGGIRV